MTTLKLRTWEFIKHPARNEKEAVALMNHMEADGWITISIRINPCVFKRYDGDTPMKPRYPVWLKPWLGAEKQAIDAHGEGRSHKDELASVRLAEAKRRRRNKR